MDRTYDVWCRSNPSQVWEVSTFKICTVPARRSRTADLGISRLIILQSPALPTELSRVGHQPNKEAWDPAKHNSFDLNLNCTPCCTSCVQHHIISFEVLHFYVQEKEERHTNADHWTHKKRWIYSPRHTNLSLTNLTLSMTQYIYILVTLHVSKTCLVFSILFVWYFLVCDSMFLSKLLSPDMGLEPMTLRLLWDNFAIP